MEPVLQASRAFKSVMAAAEAALLAIFGNTRDIIASPALLKKFLALPQPALLALLQSPTFATDAEASVLLLVSTWIKGSVGVDCSAEDTLALNSEIRYSRLSRPYLTDLCDSLVLPDLTRGELRELWAYTTLPPENQKDWADTDKLNPVQWYLPARPRVTGVNSVAAKLTLDVTEADLRRVLAGIRKKGTAIRLVSPSVYAEGFMWTLELALDDDGTVWCVVIAKGLLTAVDMTNTIDIDHGVTCFSSIQIMAAEPLQLHLAKRHLVITNGSGPQLGALVGQFKDAAGLEWWTKYIVEGRVRFQGIIKSISA